MSAWTRSHASAWIRPNAPFPLSFFSNQIGYFGEPHGWLEWDFAEPDQRRATADNLTDAIRRRVLPVFSVFEGPIEDVVTLFDHDWHRCDGLLTFLLAHGHDAIARKALARYFEGKPKDRVEFDALLQKFATEGLPPYRTLGMSDLAAFAVATGFPWTTHVAAPERD